MSDAPDNCPTCRTAIPPGALKCPGCGRVFGEDNRCPYCSAVTAVEPARGRPGYVCLACGKPREVKPGTVVLGGVLPIAGRDLPVAPPASAAPGVPATRPLVSPGVARQGGQAARRGGSAALRGFGILGIAGGVLAAAIAGAVLPGVGGVLVAAALGATGVGLGALTIRAGAKAGASADDRATTQRELAILTLAEERGGILTVTDVARALGISQQDADGALTRMADGSRITVEVTSDGIVEFVFREVRRAAPAQKVRVEAGADEVEEEIERDDEATERQDTERERGA